MKRKKNVDAMIDIFVSSTNQELIDNFSLSEFKTIVNTLPETFLFFQMAEMLLEDFERQEEYERCAILYNFLNNHQVEI